MKYLVALAVILAPFHAFAQEEEEFITETSCSLSIKVTVFPVDSSDKFGKATVEALLTDNKGNPLSDQEIKMTSTNGILSCMPPLRFSEAEVASSKACLTTHEDGTITIYLVHIPFNKPGKVKAFCTYGNFKVSAIGSYSVMKFTKSSKKPRQQKTQKIKKRIPLSGEL